jgi:hypothetical protein
MRRRQRSARPAVRPLNLAERRMARTAWPHVLCCANLRHAARWCPEFPAAFKNSGTNSNDCPQNYSRLGLETEKACISLAATAGASMYGGSDEYTYYPARCFWHTVSRKFYWNTHGSGASNSFAQPLCAGAPARPALPPECVVPVVVRTCPIVWHSGTQCSGGTRVPSTRASTDGTRVLRAQADTRGSFGTRVLAIQVAIGYR